MDLEKLVCQYKKLTELHEQKSQMSNKEWKSTTRQFRTEYWDLTEEVMLMGLKLPNYLHPDTPETVEVLEQIGSPGKMQ